MVRKKTSSDQPCDSRPEIRHNMHMTARIGMIVIVMLIFEACSTSHVPLGAAAQTEIDCSNPPPFQERFHFDCWSTGDALIRPVCVASKHRNSFRMEWKYLRVFNGSSTCDVFTVVEPAEAGTLDAETPWVYHEK